VLVGSFPNAQNREDPSEGMLNIIERQQNIWDVWCGSYAENSFILGMTNHLWFVPDLEHLESTRIIHAGSDVLSLERSDSQLYAGFRNGSVHVFDVRLHEHDGKKLLQGHTSVTSLFRLREWELLVGLIDGSLDIYDLRMLRTRFATSLQSLPSRARTPLLSMKGHVSTIMTSPPIAITPSHDFVFAAGEDNVIRAWSTVSGDTLRPPPPEDLARAHPTELDRPASLLAPSTGVTQESRFVDLRVTEYEAGQRTEPRLWAATIAGITRFDLGRSWNCCV